MQKYINRLVFRGNLRLCFSLCLLAGACHGSAVYDTSALAELTGSRSVGSGITGSGIYAQNFNLSWMIVNTGTGLWNYSYTVSGFEGHGAGLSHLVIDLSDDCIRPGDANCVTNASRMPVELGPFSSSNGNPG